MRRPRWATGRWVRAKSRASAWSRTMRRISRRISGSISASLDSLGGKSAGTDEFVIEKTFNILLLDIWYISVFNRLIEVFLSNKY